MKLSHIIKRLLLGSLCLAIFTQTALAQKHLKVLFGAAPHWIVAYEKVAKQFEADNPDVKIELLSTAYHTFNDTLAAAAMAKDLPDVILFDGPYLANYVWSGILQPIEPYIDPELIAEMTSSSRALSSYPIDGKLYAFGLLDSSVLLYGNKN